MNQKCSGETIYVVSIAVMIESLDLLTNYVNCTNMNMVCYWFLIHYFFLDYDYFFLTIFMIIIFMTINKEIKIKWVNNSPLDHIFMT
jgi:hypothetical protein